MQELRRLKARELRQELRALGLPTEGRVDRESLLELLESRGEFALRQNKAAKGPRTTGKGFGEAAAPPPPPPRPAGPTGRPKKPKYPPPASPEPGGAKIPVYMVIGVNQYGVKGEGSRVISLDLEIGKDASPCRFVLDTVSHNSIIRSQVARMLGATDIGLPPWLGGDAPFGIRQVNLGMSWLDKHRCGELKIAAVDGDLPVPLGCCGILGLDFLRLYDWDLDIKAQRAEVCTCTAGPVPFDVTGMRIAPFMKVRLPSGLDLLACTVRVRMPGEGSDGVDCMGIVDLCATRSMCNRAAAERLGVTLPPAAPSTSPDDGPTYQEVSLRFAIGDGPDGPVEVETVTSVGDVEVFETIGLASNWPAIIMGPDLLCRSRLILSPRLNSMWLKVPEKA